MQPDVCEDRCTHACMQTHTKTLLCVNINLAFGCWIIDTQTSEFQRDSARILDWSTQETQQVLHTHCFLMFAPISKAFFSKKPTSRRLLIPPCLRAFLIPSNCVGCLGNPFKSFLYWDSTLQQGSYSHYLQMHTHMQGGLTQGRPTWILGQETDSSRITPPPPHMNSLNIHRKKKIPHSTLSPSLSEPQSAVDWETLRA